MKAGLRFTIAYVAASLALAPAGARAQEAPAASTTSTTAPAATTPPGDAVGPRELQNFNLTGRVTRPADQPAAIQQAPAARSPESRTTPAPSAASSAAPRPAPARATRDQPTPTALATSDRQPPPARPAEPQRQVPAASVTVALPQLSGAAPAAPGAAFAPDPQPGSRAPDRDFGMLPWLLAALVLGAGGAFLLWRNRSREAFAGGLRLARYAASEPAPRPAPPPVPSPAPAPARVPAASIPGIVSTRLRPWIELAFRPLRCIVDGDQVTVEFEAELFNSGSVPARAVLAEASLFNAGPAQDQELGAFFAKPAGVGERIVEIGPLKRIALRSQVVAPLGQLQRYELGGHQVFVPVMAFNALYRWGSGEGQTSVSYLLGRDTKGDKLGPFRLDLGPRVFRGLAARLLPTGVRQ